MGFFNYIDLLDEFFPSLFFERKLLLKNSNIFFYAEKNERYRIFELTKFVK